MASDLLTINESIGISSGRHSLRSHSGIASMEHDLLGIDIISSIRSF